MLIRLEKNHEQIGKTNWFAIFQIILIINFSHRTFCQHKIKLKVIVFLHQADSTLCQYSYMSSNRAYVTFLVLQKYKLEIDFKK